MTGFAKASDLKFHIRTDWKHAHKIWENLYKEGSPITALLPIHQLDGTKHTVSGLTAGHVLTALTPTTFGFAAPAGGDIPAHQLDGAKHTVSGLTPGHFLKATGANTFGFAVHGLTYSDVGAAAAGHNHNGVYDPAGTAAAAVSVHAALITGVHGLVFTAGKTLTLTESLTLNAFAAIGGIAIATAANTLGPLADVAVGSYLRSGGVNTAPLWSTLILPNAATAFRLPVATGANTIGELAAVGATGEYLAGVTGAIPAWATLNQAAIPELTIASGPTFAHLHLSDLAAIYTAAESWMGPSATAGVYFKGGNYGFGTATPGTAIDIYSLTVSRSIRIRSDLTTGAAALIIYNDASHENSFYVFGSAAVGSAYAGLNTADLSMIFGNNTNALLINSYGAYPLVFATTNIERMRILAGGTILIGATAQVRNELLSVNGPDVTHAGIYFNDRVPTDTTGTLYRSGNDLYWGATKLN